MKPTPILAVPTASLKPRPAATRGKARRNTGLQLITLDNIKELLSFFRREGTQGLMLDSWSIYQRGDVACDESAKVCRRSWKRSRGSPAVFRMRWS